MDDFTLIFLAVGTATALLLLLALALWSIVSTLKLLGVGEDKPPVQGELFDKYHRCHVPWQEIHYGYDKGDDDADEV